jgi:hypothetical protein
MQTVVKSKSDAVVKFLSDKQRVLQMVAEMADSVSLKEIRFELQVLAAVDEALVAADAEDFVSDEDARKLMAKWLQD